MKRMARHGVGPIAASLALTVWTLCGPVGRADAAASLGDRLAALEARVEQHAASLPPEKRRAGPGGLAEAKLAIRKLEVLRQDRFRWYALDDAFAAAQRAVAALDGPDGREATPRTGFQERAYISELDGSAEPYLLYVPTGYDDARAWPLLVFLHGYDHDLSVVNWIDWMYSPTLQDVCEREGVILLMPYGRSNTEFMGIGESDVLRTIRYVREEYRVDPRRIILSGASMGGSGAYSVACHYPDLFAGVMVITGRIDYYLWMGVAKSSLPRFKQVQVDTDYARELLPNLAYLPVLIFHGAQDGTLNIRQSRLMYELLRERQQPCEYVEFEGMGHRGTGAMSFRHPRFQNLLRTARSPDKVRKVAFRTFSLKYPSAYWVTIEEVERWAEPAEVRAELTDAGKIVVETENVAALALGPGIPGIPDGRDASVTVNGRAVTPLDTRDGRLLIRLRPESQAAGVMKSRELCGPIREAYDGPFIIVYPSAENDLTASDRANAARLAREWEAYAQAAPRLRADSDVTEADIRDHHLILCGSPATNSVLAGIAERLPLRIEPAAYVVGSHVFPTAGNGLQMIYPNPQNPSRYVLVVHGAQWGAELQPNHRLDLLPDFIIYSCQTERDDTMFPTNRFLCAGYFDGNWRLSENSTWLNVIADDPPRVASTP